MLSTRVVVTSIGSTLVLLFIGVTFIWLDAEPESVTLPNEMMVTPHSVSFTGTTSSRWSENVSLGIRDALMSVEVVSKPDERRKGLSGREVIAEDAGMLFVFPTDELHGIWMPDMHFSIDILWLDTSLQVVDVHEGATPESYPEAFMPRRRARYVLEVPSGFVQTHGVRVGDVVTVQGGVQ
ncbi:MAG: DUF192 domain-containing protein [Candidatus Pacebacteria bacterium]|nr:DUF192 domain-containing protein [Candidatus Paceibacterota bacterium]